MPELAIFGFFITLFLVLIYEILMFSKGHILKGLLGVYFKLLSAGSFFTLIVFEAYFVWRFFYLTDPEFVKVVTPLLDVVSIVAIFALLLIGFRLLKVFKELEEQLSLGD